jgi:two-component SAPR family response regulator
MMHGLAGKRILIVEDEIIVALDLANKITAEGAKAVGAVSTVNAALDVIANTELDGVILDIKLREEMAFPVADVLAVRHIPFVFMTALDAGDIPSRHANIRRVQKPAGTEVICRALEATIFAAQD